MTKIERGTRAAPRMMARLRRELGLEPESLPPGALWANTTPVWVPVDDDDNGEELAQGAYLGPPG